MQEKQLIGKLKELRQIKPSKNWASLTKKDILGDEPGFTFFPYFKPAFAGFVAVFALFGALGFAQNSLPGDILYVFKKTFENSQAAFVSDNDQSAFQLKLANDRLEDLTKAPAKNLAPTMDEFQANMSAAAKSLAKFDASTSDAVVIKKLVSETKKLEGNKQKIESLGVVLDQKGADEFNSALAKVVENLINDLEERTLTEEKSKMVSQMKELFEAGKYSDALELYLVNQ
ncbi:MAG: hypothetical protein Q7S60_01470 [bacterium]|nr:hypothetical protein [bacterium]